MLTLLLLACVDPDFGHLGKALEAYDRGTLAMAEGDSKAAISAFAEAVLQDPTRPSLRSWEARALMEAGLTDRAVASLNRGLATFPDDAAMRYQRAAVLVKKGDIESAAADLRRLYANEQVHPIEVGEDPDFLALRVDPLYAELVPSAHVEASVYSQQDSVLLGDAYTIEFSITSRTGSPVQIRLQGEPMEKLAIERVVEDVVERGRVWTKRSLVVEFKAIETGQIAMGPWFVESGKTGSLTERLVVSVVAIPGRTLSLDHKTMSMVVPSVRWGREPPADLVHESNELWAVMASDMSVTPGDAKLGPRLEYREAGQPKWVALMLDPNQSIELRSGGKVLKQWSKKLSSK